MSSNRGDEARLTGSASDVLRPNSDASPPSMERNIARLTTGSGAWSGSAVRVRTGVRSGSGTSASASTSGWAISAAWAAAAALTGPDARLSLSEAGTGEAEGGAISSERGPVSDAGSDDEVTGEADDDGRAAAAGG